MTRQTRPPLSAPNTAAIKASIAETLIAFRTWSRQETVLGMPTPTPLIVFVLKRDHEILDVYASDTAAFDAADRFRRSSTVAWSQSRPGRWWSPLGAISIDPWVVKS